MEYVRCNRQAGYGSSAMKKMNISAIMQVVGMLPQDGKNNLLDDMIAAYGGVDKIDRYNPKVELPTPDEAWAAMENSMMHNGESPVIFSGQNQVKHLVSHFKDAHETLDPLAATVQADQPDVAGIQEALPYVKAFIPHVTEHLQILSMDPTSKGLVKQFQLELKDLLSFSNKMFLVLRDAQREQQLAAMEQQNANALGIMDQVKLQGETEKLEMSRQKFMEKQRQNELKFQGAEERANLKAVNDVRRNNITTANKIVTDQAKTNGSNGN
jgi:hypothetical protein